MKEDFSDGWPRFLASKAMPDGQLAVAIQRGKEIFVGQVSLNGMDIRPSRHGHSINACAVSLITNGSHFVAITLEQYNQLTYHQYIPVYQHISVDQPQLENKSNG